MGLFGFNKKVAMPTPEQALPGRQQKNARTCNPLCQQ